MPGLLQKFFGDANQREVKRLFKTVEAVNALEERMASLSDDELKRQTALFKERLGRGEKEDDLLPEAFAAAREAARRFTGMRPFDVQVLGGVVLHQGRVAEMKTGEGKTLVATMPAYLNALSGEGVHVVTVNDYLARRDSEWMGRVYRGLGLEVGLIVHGLSSSERRRGYAADVTYGTNNEFGFDYLRDNMVLYKDQMVQRRLHYAIVDEVDSILIDEARTPLIISSRVESSEAELYRRWNKPVASLMAKQRKIVREFIEEAQRKLEAGDREEAGLLLLMARRGMPKNKNLLKLMKEPGVAKLVEQVKHRLSVEKRMHEIDEQLYFALEETTGMATLSQMGYREMARVEPEAARLLGFDKNEDEFDEWETLENGEEGGAHKHTFEQLLKAYTLYEKDVDYVVNTGEGEPKVVIVDEFTGRLMWGRRYSEGLHQAIEAKEGVKIQESSRTVASITFQNYFRMYKKLAGMTGTAATEEDELRKIYGMDVVVVPTNKEMIRRDLPDLVYRTEQAKFRAVVEEIARRHQVGQPVLVGTISVEKSEMLSRMLKRKGLPHHVLNAVNHQKEAEIIAQAGRRGALTISTNMAGRGTDILLGGNPEFLARQALEKELVRESQSAAGGEEQGKGKGKEQAQEQAVVDPVAANPQRYKEILDRFREEMEKERREILELGGLHVLGTERHESRRIDNQLRGRAGRQGDPGSSQFFISLEDDLMRLFGSSNIAGILDKLGMEEDMPLDHPLIGRAIENAQKKVEGRNFEIRKHLLDYDDVLNKQREVIYGQRRRVLEGENLKEQILEMIAAVIDEVLERRAGEKVYDEDWDLPGLIADLEGVFLPAGSVTPEALTRLGREEIREWFNRKAQELYRAREEELGTEILRELERVVLLRVVDRKWMDHIDAMHDLRQGINLQAYGQRDPLVEYRLQAYEMFEAMIASLHRDVVRLLFHVRVTVPPQRRAVFSSTSAITPESRGAPLAAAKNEPVKPRPRTVRKVGRNAPCPCGSGKKYKKCCGKPE